MTRSIWTIALSCLVILANLPNQTIAQAWPSFRHDHQHSGRVGSDMDPGRLAQQWVWSSPVPPAPAWDGPARWDAFAEIRDLPAMRQYDACFQPVSDGQHLFFGSSSQDTLYALDLKTGQPLWQFVAGGPLRIAPTIAKEKILFGCDDGFAYCLKKNNGSLVWKFSPARHAGAHQRAVVNNDRLISFFPIRTGVVVRDGIAYFGASFLPWKESYLAAVDVETGAIDSPRKTYVSRHENATLEGPLLIADDHLIVPQGRIAPLLFDRSTGKSQGSLPGGGGVTIVLTEQGEVARAEGGKPARPGQVGVYKNRQRVASFPRGRALVVQKDAYFVVDRQNVFGVSRQANQLLWRTSLQSPLEIIMVGKYLVVGETDRLSVIDSKNGRTVWQHDVDGRVFGLIYAADRLIASTDTGKVYCFQPTADRNWTPPTATDAELTNLPPCDLPALLDNDKRELLHRWVLMRKGTRIGKNQIPPAGKLGEARIVDQAASVDLVLTGEASSIQVRGNQTTTEAIELQGGSFPVKREQLGKLPTDHLTAEAWIRVDEPATWGGIVGCIQDDGSVEHGWLLGYSGSQFSVALAGTASGLTYLKCPQSFEPKGWYHVAGTYDGSRLLLYVNGKLVAESTAEKGPISYSDKSFFTVGAYRDANEFYPLKGALQEVRIYSRTLDAETIQRHYQSRASWFPKPVTPEKTDLATHLEWGPYLRFIKPHTAELTYGTLTPCPSRVQLKTPRGQVRLISTAAKTTNHRVLLDQLPVRRIVQYRIQYSEASSAEPENATWTDWIECDSHFDWNVSINSGAKENNRSSLLKQLANPNGLIYLFGKKHQALATQLARQSECAIVLFVQDEDVANSIRQQWIQRSDPVYGRDLSVSTLNEAEIPPAAAQLVIVADKSDQSQRSGRRLVRPAGGILSDGNSVLWKRGKLPGAGDWTHMYGRPDNSAFGGEALGEASNREDLVTNWIGRPGPRYQTDRQNRKPAPLAANGRLYLQGQQRMIALDSYSGTVLWSVEAPTVMRWNVPRDSSNWCADDDGVFVASGSEAWFLSGKDGQITRRFKVPGIESGTGSGSKSGLRLNWGYIARKDSLLLGTAVRADATYRDWWGKSKWFDSTSGDDTRLVAGDLLFGIDLNNDRTQWTYRGLILHPTITLMNDNIYFVEDRTPEHLTDDNRRIRLDRNQTLELVCLSLSDGSEVFRRKLHSFDGPVAVLYLAGGGQGKNRSLILSASESSRSEFSVSCFNPADGTPRWQKRIKWEANHHGKHISRPALENDLVYIRPEVLELASGKTIRRGFPAGHGCASYTLCKNGLFSRLGETTWWNVRQDKVARFQRVRTDCWISVIPAQGMLLSAEGGGGCSCGSWLETSMGFLPRAFDQVQPEE